MAVEEPVGGGASPSTEPAAGSSAATDISLREHMAAQLAALDRYATRELWWLDRHYAALREADREANTIRFNAGRMLREANRAGDQLAIQAALASQKELAEKHNDLIRTGERKDATYATKSEMAALFERFDSAMTAQSEKLEALIGPLIGTRREGIGASTSFVVVGLGTVATIITIVVVLANWLAAG